MIFFVQSLKAAKKANKKNKKKKKKGTASLVMESEDGETATVNATTRWHHCTIHLGTAP